MFVPTSYGPVFVSDQAPYFKDWLGRQAYKYRVAQARRAAQVDEQP
jgi:hypothetical protein